MINTFCNIGSNNFTKLLNKLDEQEKLNMKEVKDLMKKNEHQLANEKKQIVDEENGMSAWRVRKCIECLNKNGGTKTGNNKYLQKICSLLMALFVIGKKDVITMKTNELELKATNLRLEINTRSRENLLKTHCQS